MACETPGTKTLTKYNNNSPPPHPPTAHSYEADIDRLASEGKAKALDLAGQHGAQLRGQLRSLAGQGTVVLRGIQEKAMERAKAASAKLPAGHHD